MRLALRYVTRYSCGIMAALRLHAYEGQTAGRTSRAGLGAFQIGANRNPRKNPRPREIIREIPNSQRLPKYTTASATWPSVIGLPWKALRQPRGGRHES